MIREAVTAAREMNRACDEIQAIRSGSDLYREGHAHGVLRGFVMGATSAVLMTVTVCWLLWGG